MNLIFTCQVPENITRIKTLVLIVFLLFISNIIKGQQNDDWNICWNKISITDSTLISVVKDLIDSTQNDELNMKHIDGCTPAMYLYYDGGMNMNSVYITYELKMQIYFAMFHSNNALTKYFDEVTPSSKTRGYTYIDDYLVILLFDENEVSKLFIEIIENCSEFTFPIIESKTPAEVFCYFVKTIDFKNNRWELRE